METPFHKDLRFIRHTVDLLSVCLNGARAGHVVHVLSLTGARVPGDLSTESLSVFHFLSLSPSIFLFILSSGHLCEDFGTLRDTPPTAVSV